MGQAKKRGTFEERKAQAIEVKETVRAELERRKIDFNVNNKLPSGKLAAMHIMSLMMQEAQERK